MKLKLDNRAKDSIVKLLALVVVMIVLTVVLALILDRVVGAADLVEETELVGGVIADVADETASEMAEDGMIVANTDEPDEILVEDDQLGFFDEVGDAFTDYIDSVSDLLFGTDDDVFPGVPSDVPPDALSWPESGALIEPESEVLMELKAIDFSDYPYDESWAVALAQLAWVEGRGLSMREQSLVMWTVLNRLDVCYDGRSDFWSILTAPYQFAYYPNSPYEEYEYRIAVDVLQRWAAEKDGVVDSGRTLPKGYLYYWGDGAHNYFGMNGFSNELYFGLGDPYEDWTA